MGGKAFSAKLVRMEGVGTWTYCDVPFDVEKAFGKGGQVKVKGTVNGISFKSTLLPNGDGNHFLVVPKPLRDKAKVKPGDRVKVVVEPDAAARIIEPPPDLAKALPRTKPPSRPGTTSPRRTGRLTWSGSSRPGRTRRGPAGSKRPCS